MDFKQLWNKDERFSDFIAFNDYICAIRMTDRAEILVRMNCEVRLKDMVKKNWLKS